MPGSTIDNFCSIASNKLYLKVTILNFSHSLELLKGKVVGAAEKWKPIFLNFLPHRCQSQTSAATEAFKRFERNFSAVKFLVKTSPSPVQVRPAFLEPLAVFFKGSP